MFIALSAIGLSLVVGVPLGLLAGTYSGTLDMIIMRAQDGLLAFPSILFAILVVSALGPSAFTIILVMALVYVPRFARLVRGSVLTIKQLDYVLASRVIGAPTSRIMFRTILPNTMAPVLVQATIGMAFTILTEASLSYLGLGVQPPTPTWGTMLQAAQRFSVLAPWYLLAPGVSIFLTVLVFNFLGDRLRDHLDPRLRGARSA
ncbi:MAG: ABC transporter permease [Ardenticatenaceae bacterium]|nr:ABC transporter permease [Ardenticatenaceae bacterium]